MFINRQIYDNIVAIKRKVFQYEKNCYNTGYILLR